MNNFKDFRIKTDIRKSFKGEKIKISKILNREIIVHDYRIEDSKYEKGSGKCLWLQIEYNEKKHVAFTGSVNLMQIIEKVPRTTGFPFKTIIIEEDERYEFT